MSRPIAKGKSPPPPFPIFQRATQLSTKEATQDPIQAVESEEEFEEPLEDPRIRRRSARASLTSPPKRIRLTEAVPRFPEPEPEPEPEPSPLEEIELFSDESQRLQAAAMQQERSRKRYTGLQLVDLSEPLIAPRTLPREETTGMEPSPRHLNFDMSLTLSPILPAKVMDSCPLCSKRMPAEELAAHVEAEFQEKDREEQYAIERQDQEMALALEKTFQTQDIGFDDEGTINGRQRVGWEQPSTQYPPRDRTGVNGVIRDRGRRQETVVSVDSPTRQVRNMTLNSPPSKLQKRGRKNVRSI